MAEYSTGKICKMTYPVLSPRNTKKVSVRRKRRCSGQTQPTISALMWEPTVIPILPTWTATAILIYGLAREIPASGTRKMLLIH